MYNFLQRTQYGRVEKMKTVCTISGRDKNFTVDTLYYYKQ